MGFKFYPSVSNQKCSGSYKYLFLYKKNEAV